MNQTIIYPSGYSYQGRAVEERMYFQVLKTYSFSDAKNMLLSAIMQGAQNNGLILLRTDLSSTEGFLYHEFTATTSYFNPNQPMGTDSLAFPVALLIYAVAVILSLILVYYIIREVKEIVYGPPGTTGGGIQGSMVLIAIAFLGIMILKRK